MSNVYSDGSGNMIIANSDAYITLYTGTSAAEYFLPLQPNATSNVEISINYISTTGDQISKIPNGTYQWTEPVTNIVHTFNPIVYADLQSDEMNKYNEIYNYQSSVGQLNATIKADNTITQADDDVIAENPEIIQTALNSQNTALADNLKMMQGTNAANEQLKFYLDLQTDYLIRINFYLFYLYMLLAILFFFPCFFDGSTAYSLWVKILFYLHVFFYPYLVVYYEFVFYYLLVWIRSWISGNPFYPWTNYTSYPPII